MKRIIFIFSLLINVLLPGCIEEFNLNPNFMEPRLVVEGVVTNQPGPYYIRLTESHTGNFIEPGHSSIDSAIAIMNAIVIISDNVSQFDTLIPIDVNIDEYRYDYRHGYYKYLYDNFGNIIDTLWLKDPPEFRHDRGFYKTKNLIGIPGRTYFLKVISGEKEYQASAFMPPVPGIDSIGYLKKVWEPDGQEYYVPLLYFSEPQGIDNYYLIQLDNEILSRRVVSHFFWRFSILSDEFLPPYVNGLNINTGANPRGIDAIGGYWAGDSIYVALSSLTKEGYLFYQALLQQFRNDGGAYQPSPASPPTNISNGGLGLFRATSISEKRTKIPITN